MINARTICTILIAFNASPAAMAEKVVTYYLTDSQGTPLATTDASGTVTAVFEVTPYGVAKLDPPGTRGFGSHVIDEGSNSIYMQARYYDPETGRFLSVDPAPTIPGVVGAIGRYGYGLANPFTYSDPTGADAEDDRRNAPMLPPTIVRALRWPDPILIGGSTISSFIDDRRVSVTKPLQTREKSLDEMASCISTDRWDWGQLGPSGEDKSELGAVSSGAAIANTAGNILAGPTGSGIARASHATSWQHALSASIGRTAQRASTGRSFGPLQAKISAVGKFAGRAALLPTVWEGFYDLAAEARCSRMIMY